jgi:probable proteasome subunit beta type-2
MECLLGITGKDFALVASDSNAARSIIKMKADDDKQKVLNKHMVMAFAGESGTSCS